MMKLIIKCSDINHPARPTHLHKRWCQLIQEEFFQQGDQGASLGLPVSRWVDRAKSNPKDIAKGNCGFIHFIVQPLFKIMETRIKNPQFSKIITINLAHWQKTASRLNMK
mmetsp:Transcript_9235/g.22685  ORF Transcript_9235/g.22685 Transcript_9235/m.22685 type:complete len:110 (+) Transcript_9235:404-733(+)